MYIIEEKMITDRKQKEFGYFLLAPPPPPASLGTPINKRVNILLKLSYLIRDQI